MITYDNGSPLLDAAPGMGARGRMTRHQRHEPPEIESPGQQEGDYDYARGLFLTQTKLSRGTHNTSLREMVLISNLWTKSLATSTDAGTSQRQGDLEPTSELASQSDIRSLEQAWLDQIWDEIDAEYDDYSDEDEPPLDSSSPAVEQDQDIIASSMPQNIPDAPEEIPEVPQLSGSISSLESLDLSIPRSTLAQYGYVFSEEEDEPMRSRSLPSTPRRLSSPSLSLSRSPKGFSATQSVLYDTIDIGPPSSLDRQWKPPLLSSSQLPCQTQLPCQAKDDLLELWPKTSYCDLPALASSSHDATKLTPSIADPDPLSSDNPLLTPSEARLLLMEASSSRSKKALLRSRSLSPERRSMRWRLFSFN